MIERELVAQRIKEFRIQEYVKNNLRHAGHSATKVQRTPLGEKIIIYASRPGIIVGKKGSNIKKLTQTLKNKFKLENPQIEISEIESPDLDASIIAERIANSLERFGSSRFKGVGHKSMEAVMQAGAMGVEIIISGKIPSSRARSWRFYQGYLKKCGDIALTGVSESITSAKLKSGTVGIQVRIMPPDIELPDRIKLLDEPQQIIEEVSEGDDSSNDAKKAKGRKESTGSKAKERKSANAKKSQKDKPLKDKSPAKKTTKKQTKKEPAKSTEQQPDKASDAKKEDGTK